MKQITETPTVSLLTHVAGYDPIEDRLRSSVRATIEAMFEEELAECLGRIRYGRGAGRAKGYRHGHRDRQLTGTFGSETLRVPRARIEDEEGKFTEWRSKALPRYRRLTKKAEALIAAVYLAGTNTRRVKRALFGLFEGAVSKDVVSRAWRKVKVDWDAMRGRRSPSSGSRSSEARRYPENCSPVANARSLPVRSRQPSVGEATRRTPKATPKTHDPKVHPAPFNPTRLDHEPNLYTFCVQSNKNFTFIQGQGDTASPASTPMRRP